MSQTRPFDLLRHVASHLSPDAWEIVTSRDNSVVVRSVGTADPSSISIPGVSAAVQEDETVLLTVVDWEEVPN